MLAALLGALSLFHAVPAEAQAPAAPTGLTVTQGDAELTLSWNASTGALRYHVHYTSAPASGTGAVANNAVGLAGNDHATGWINIAASTTATLYRIGLPNGITFRVRVRANNASGNSAWVFGTGTPTAPNTATLAASSTTVTEGQTVTFTVSLTSAATQVVSGFDPAFEYRVTRVTSEHGDHDLTELNNLAAQSSFFFPMGQTSHTFEIATRHEATEDQEDETFTVTLVGVLTGYAIGSPSSVTITIIDDDKPSVSLSASPNPVQEGSPVTVTASLSHATVPALTIPVTLTAGTAESGDYGTLTSISIAAGATSGTGTVTTVQDADSDGETFTAALGTTLPSTVTRGSPDSVEVTISDKITVTLGPASLRVNEGKKAVLNLGFSDCKNNNYVGIPVITTRLTSESGGWRLSRGASGKGGISPDVLSYGPDHDFGLGNLAQRHTLTPPTHSCGSGDVYIDTYRDCDTEDETFTVELGDTMPDGYVRGSQYKVTVTIIDDGGQEFCTRTPPPARQPADQPPPNTEETDTDDGTPATPANTGGSGGGGGGFSGGTPAGGPPTGGGGDLPPSGSSDEPPPEDEGLSTLCSQEDRETLGNFYETTGGENWDENENWNSPEPPQEWFGVETDEDGNVVSLRLSHNVLSGEVPARELLCLSELKELALWGNDLSGEEPEKLVLAVERAVLRDMAEMLDLNPEWFDNYDDPYNFEDWHEGVTTDDDGRVVELDLTGAEIPESVSELKRLREIMITSSGGGGCAMGASQGRMGASALLVAILMLLALSRGLRARRD